ncbi:Pkinase-domain-containing protein [Morchella conica CCBAS932]|uniref:Pkinase-domain-containing protein n=1 Tax=Morchella conica CCBAS932 TaxID=1392247 RepID=A0A3N4KW41_9PEZI|nr:Pkinase-domain-containing protein [Morchella conica CCBAS932]
MTATDDLLLPAEDRLAQDLNDDTQRKYEKDRKVGEGTYAVVHLGHVRATGLPVAIKKIKVSAMQDGISMDAIREVKFLQELRHENVIRLLDVFSSKNQNLNLVLEFLDGDLEFIIRDKDITFNGADIKSWMAMSLRGLWWCHKNFVLHRDIKPNNLLLSTNGQLKLADFGLARSFSDPYRAMTSNVITRWYRPPELLFGAKYYSSAVDIFSLALVFVELIIRLPYLAGDSDVHQLQLIARWLGTPTEQNWPGVTSLPEYVIPNKDDIQPERDLYYYQRTFPTISPAGMEVLYGMLRLDPRKRVSAKEALEGEWFREDPPPTRPESEVQLKNQESN